METSATQTSESPAFALTNSLKLQNSQLMRDLKETKRKLDVLCNWIQQKFCNHGNDYSDQEQQGERQSVMFDPDLPKEILTIVYNVNHHDNDNQDTECESENSANANDLCDQKLFTQNTGLYPCDKCPSLFRTLLALERHEMKHCWVIVQKLDDKHLKGLNRTRTRKRPRDRFRISSENEQSSSNHMDDYGDFEVPEVPPKKRSARAGDVGAADSGGPKVHKKRSRVRNQVSSPTPVSESDDDSVKVPRKRSRVRNQVSSPTPESDDDSVKVPKKRSQVRKQKSSTFPVSLGDTVKVPRKRIRTIPPKINLSNCFICSFRFPNLVYKRCRHDYFEHLITGHNILYTGEQLHSFVFPEEFQQQKFTCPYCPLIQEHPYTDPKNLLQHVKVQHNEDGKYYNEFLTKLRPDLYLESVRIYNTCKPCKTYFESEAQLKAHDQGIHYLPCPHCERKFKLNASLKDHVLTHHSNVRKDKDGNILSEAPVTREFLCQTCGSAFITKENLKSHIKLVHTEERPFQCKFCPYAGKTRQYLRDHLQNKHLEESGLRDPKVQCELCGEKLSSVRTKRRHIQSVHLGLRKYTCDKCGKMFKTTHCFKRHLQLHETKPDFQQRNLKLNTERALERRLAKKRLKQQELEQQPSVSAAASPTTEDTEESSSSKRLQNSISV